MKQKSILFSVFLICVCLFIAAPAAADTVSAGTLTELSDAITGAVGVNSIRTIIITSDINVGATAAEVIPVINTGQNITIKPAADRDYTITRTGTGTGQTNNGLFTLYGGELNLENNSARILILDGNSILTNEYGLITVGDNTATVASDAVFRFYDGRLINSAMGVTVDSGGEFEMYGGTITKNGNIGTGNPLTAVTVSGETSTFRMYGGTITDNHGEAGGGVSAGFGATFEMYGGEISDNLAKWTGGGVYLQHGNSSSPVLPLQTTFNMSGGRITGNTVAAGQEGGGGVSCWSGITDPNLGAIVINLNGGEISRNSADFGGAVLAFSNDDHDPLRLTINGCNISNNKATAMTSGAFFLNLNPESSVVISGDTMIANNTAAWSGGGMYLYGNSKVSMSGGTIANNTARYGGGVCLWKDAGKAPTFTMTGGTISSNAAVWDGGGLFLNDDSTFSMSGSSRITGNTALGTTANTGKGGGIYARNAAGASTLTITGGSIDNNTAGWYGGGICLEYDAIMTISGTTISDNAVLGTGSDSGSGGGICLLGDASWRCRLDVSDTTISGNTAVEYGGGIQVWDANITLTRTTITGNTAPSGAGFYGMEDSNVTISASSITHNKATGSHGGGMNLWTRSYLLLEDDSRITDNTAEKDGGGLYLWKESHAAVKNSRITDNDATGTGGGIAITPGCTFTMSGGEISGNTAGAANGGGGITQSGGDVTLLDSCSVTGNSAFSGGGVYQTTGTFTLRDSSIAGNEAAKGGGYYLHQLGILSLHNGSITGNHATGSGDSGGGVYITTAGSVLTMDGTSRIADNIAEGDGGGVYLKYGRLNLVNGEITNNTAGRNGGGGIYHLGGNALGLDMTGGKITGNKITAGKGEELRYQAGIFNISGTAEIGPGNTSMNTGRVINVSSFFTGKVINIIPDTTTGGTKIVDLPPDATDSYLSNFLLSPTLAGVTLVYKDDNADKRIEIATVPTYLLNVVGGTGTGSYTESAVVSIAATVPAGQLFDYWSANVTVTFANANDASTTVTMPAEDVEVTAHFKNSPVPPTPTPVPPTPTPIPPTPVPQPTGSGNMDNAFRVLFDTAGGSTISPVTGLSYGDIISAPSAPAREGYTFGGWYTDEGLTAEWSFADRITGDMTLYAKWTPLGVTPTATVTVPATVTAPVTATVTATATAPVVTASQTQEPTIQPDTRTDNPQQTSLPGFISQHLTVLAAAALAALFLFWFFLVRRKTVTFLVPTTDGIKQYRIKVRKNHTIDPDKLPDELRRHTWYLDTRHTDRWNYDEDTVVESITLSPGENR